VSDPARPSVSPSKGRRWHDLDALRAFAMLLGIGLHAALSFYPSAWPVQDVKADADGLLDEVVLAIHGFRMPLFFMLSGFFTALLWRRRGLSSLLSHRMRRIVLPFVLGVLLVGPTVTWVVDRAVEDQLVDSRDLGAAVYLGYDGAVETMLDRGVDIDAPGEDGYTALYLAAVAGDTEAIEMLVARGADPNVPTEDGFAVDAAAFFGHQAAAEALVAAGSYDPRAGGRWQDLPYWELGAGSEEAIAEDDGALSWLPDLHHLWFLWFLVLFVILFAPLAWLAERRGSVGPATGPTWLMLLMIPLVWLPQLAMEGGETIPAFGPDTSIGWIPELQVFAYYLVFFTFGILLYGRTGRSGAPLVDSIGRPWWIVLPAAAVVLVLGMWATFDLGEDLKPLAAALQVGYAWLMVFGLMAFFRVILSGEHRSVRFLSDASYWMYLMHLTLVIALQAWVRTWEIPAIVKFAIIVALAFSVLLVTYRYLVRYTPIGTMLNGKRTRPKKGPASGAQEAAPEAAHHPDSARR
jgi:peptidoglycan/LPS O-acetylase OafA/YrhL